MVPPGVDSVATLWHHMVLHACGSLTVFIHYKFFPETIEVHFNPCPGDSINQLMISKVASMCACAPVEEKKMIMIATAGRVCRPKPKLASIRRDLEGSRGPSCVVQFDNALKIRQVAHLS
jgi:hypothetical protein